MSKLLPLEAGIPKGSILGLVFYTIFSNELPQVIHESERPMRDIGDRFLIFIAFLLYFTHTTSSGSEYSSPGQFMLTICSFIYPCAKS